MNRFALHLVAIWGITGIASTSHAQWTVTSLNPAGSPQSYAYAISGVQQVGHAQVGAVNRASLWSGTAGSWVDLHPEGSTDSVATAIGGGYQVGHSDGRASLWSGTAASWVDLHVFLPDGFVDSYAQGISSDGPNTYIAGYGFNSLAGRNEALLWTRPIPAPGAAAVVGIGGLLAARRRR